MTMKARLVVVSVLAWIIFVALALPSFSIGDTVIAVSAPIVGIVAGGLKGLSIGLAIAMQTFSGPITLPALSGAMFGAVAGILSGWLGRAYFRKHEKFSRSFISSLFSPEILEGNLAGFVCRLIVSTAIGFALSVIFSSVGMFDPTTHIGANWQVILGGGPGGYPLGDSVIGLLFALFYMLGALLIACGIAGLGVGGVLGALIGAGFSSVGVPAFIAGASEGLTFRLFEPFRPGNERSGRVIYFVAGAGAGAAQGVLVGFGTGAVLFMVQLVHIFG